MPFSAAKRVLSSDATKLIARVIGKQVMKSKNIIINYTSIVEQFDEYDFCYSNWTTDTFVEGLKNGDEKAIHTARLLFEYGCFDHTCSAAQFTACSR